MDATHSIPMEVAPRERTVPGLLRLGAQRFGDAPLLRHAGAERSYATMADAVSAAAGTLRAAGIAEGDRVAVMCENRVELLDLILGCAWIGAIAVPLNTSLRGAGLAHQLGDSGARILAMDGDLLSVLTDIELPITLERVWALDPVAAVPEGVPIEPVPVGTPATPADVAPGATAAVIYTSGTTGPAKGVQCPHAQFYWWGVQMADQLRIGPDDVLYTPLPMFHINALGAFFQALITGAVLHLGPRFSASRMLERLQDAGATVTYLLGAMVSILTARPATGLDRDHAVTRALAPATPAAQMNAFRERFGIELVEAYGSTETNAAIGAPLGAQRAGWMGPVRTGFEAIVADADDNPVPDGQLGELLLRSSHPFALANGYLGAPEKTVAAWRNLWFHTGDLVERSPDGWFRFRDRLSDSIRRRGENISSHDVEQAVGSHPAVSQVVAYAVPSDLGEDEVAVAVVVAAGERVTEEELVRWAQRRIAYFAVPRFVRFLSELPLTANGKVRKSVLRAEGAAAAWDRETAGIVVSRATR